MKESLSKSQRVDLALSYRLMKDAFLDEEKVKGVNDALAEKKGRISNKSLKMSLNTSSRSSWEMGVMPHLDDIPLTLVGKGEQNSVKIKLALESSAESHIVLIEEAENHLSFSNLNRLISDISERRGNRQLLITTHSSFVLNKLEAESVILFERDRHMTLKELTPDTQEYFMRLPGHDTLRMILATRSILVEGPSDELIVQAAFYKVHKKMPLDMGIDIISVRSLAFRRFLEIAVLLNKEVAVVTDNDGDVGALVQKYKSYTNNKNIALHYDSDQDFPTLEPQLLKVNGRNRIEKILDKSFDDDDALRKFMHDNKTDTALNFLRPKNRGRPLNISSMPSSSRIIICAAGGGKTTTIVQNACSESASRCALITYTRNNEREIHRKFYNLGPAIPAHVEVMSWFTFLLRELARPYRPVLHTERIDGFSWQEGRSVPFIAERHTSQHYFYEGRYIYSDKIAKFVCECNRLSGGMVMGRLAQRFDHIFIDEVQDLAGYDLEILELALRAGIQLTLSQISQADPSHQQLENEQCVCGLEISFRSFANGISVTWPRSRISNTPTAATSTLPASVTAFSRVSLRLSLFRTILPDMTACFLVPPELVSSYIEGFAPQIPPSGQEDRLATVT